jgi:hypothetical protein
MLTAKEIDQLENYLFNATLQDVPRVFAKVLPLVFSELRIMQGALDKQTEDFFSEATNLTSGARVDSAAISGRDDVLANRGPVPAPSATRNSGGVPVGEGIENQRVATGRSPLPRIENGSSEPLEGRGLEPPLGGEVRRKKRGRPPKRSQPVDAVLAEPSGALPMEQSPKLPEEN